MTDESPPRDHEPADVGETPLPSVGKVIACPRCVAAGTASALDLVVASSELLAYDCTEHGTVMVLREAFCGAYIGTEDCERIECGLSPGHSGDCRRPQA